MADFRSYIAEMAKPTPTDTTNTNISSPEDGFFLDWGNRYGNSVDDYGQAFSFRFENDGGDLEVGRGKRKFSVNYIDITLNRRGKIIDKYFTGSDDDMHILHCTGEAKRITDKLGKMCKPLVKSLVTFGKDSKLVKERKMTFSNPDYKIKDADDYVLGASPEEIDSMLKKGKLD